MRAFLTGILLVLVWWVGPMTGFGQNEPAASMEAAAEAPVFDATATKDLKAQEGRKVVVFGHTEGSGKSPSGTNFVNFQGADFYLTAFKSDLDPFEKGEPADLYDGKRIVVTGVISIYRDKPQIKLTSPNQVRILAEGEVFPPEPSPDPVAVRTVPEKEAAQPETEKAPEGPKEQPAVDWRKYFK